MRQIYLTLAVLCFFLTASAASIKSTAKGGQWLETSTWEGGIVPSENDEVVITTNSKVTVTQLTRCGALQIAGILDFTAGPFIVNGDLIVQAGGQFRAWAGGSLSIVINGNFVNNGMADISRNGVVVRLAAPRVPAATIVGGTAFFVKGVVRTLRIDNPSGVTLTVPLSVSAGLGLWAGKFTTGTNLSLDNMMGGNGKPTASVRIEKKSGSLSGQYNKGKDATIIEE